MLSYERYIADCETHAQGLCRKTREQMGLHPEPEINCEREPCRFYCPFTGEEEEEAEGACPDLEREATHNYMQSCCCGHMGGR